MAKRNNAQIIRTPPTMAMATIDLLAISNLALLYSAHQKEVGLSLSRSKSLSLIGLAYRIAKLSFDNSNLVVDTDW